MRAGDAIATLGRTGIVNSDAHLHFGISITEDGVRRYIDPEPILAAAEVLETPSPFKDGVVDEPGIERGLVIANALTPTSPRGDNATHLVVFNLFEQHSKFPIRNATVSTTDDSGQTIWGTLTSPGRAVLAVNDSGSKTVSIRAPGYAPEQRLIAVDDDENVDVELRRSARLAGEVRDANGVRVAGATVTLGLAATRTDASGRFVLRDAATGSVVLEASSDAGTGSLALYAAPGDDYVTLQINLAEP